MKFYSINRKAPSATLREAVMNGLAPDGGLYMPERIPVIPKAFFNNISGMSIRDIAFVVADLMLGSDIDSSDIREIVNDTFSFDIPLVRIDKDIYSLELFHGPTLAFKDVGARFLARVISRLSSRSESRMVKVLLATSGDSGGAVAAGFKDVPGVELFILYPSERLSRMQLDRLNVPGSQVHAIEVLGTFDDCQRLVKEAFPSTSAAFFLRCSISSMPTLRLSAVKVVSPTMWWCRSLPAISAISQPVFLHGGWGCR